MVHLLYLWLKNCDSQILQVWDLLPPALFLPGHSSTDIHLFSHLKLGSVRKWGGHRKYSSVSLSYVSIRIYIDIRDKEWLLSLVSYLELVDCMDRKCHEIVYMKSWPNTDSKLWTCSTHSLGTPIRAHPICWNLLKPAWPRANPACAIADACMPPQTVSDYSWVFVPFVISRGLHRGSLPKRDKLLENTHTVGLIFWGSCSPDCRSTDPSNEGSCDRLGWKTEGLSGYCHLFSLGCAWQRRHRKRTRFSILHCLSCDRVGRRFIPRKSRGAGIVFLDEMTSHGCWSRCFGRKSEVMQLCFGDSGALEWKPLFVQIERCRLAIRAQAAEERPCPEKGSDRISCATNAGQFLVLALPKVAGKCPSLPSFWGWHIPVAFLCKL